MFLIIPLILSSMSFLSTISVLNMPIEFDVMLSDLLHTSRSASHYFHHINSFTAQHFSEKKKNQLKLLF